MDKQPKNALVTGGAHRIGRAICLALAEAGYGVCIHYHASKTAAEEFAQEMTGRGLKAAAVAADLAEES